VVCALAGSGILHDDFRAEMLVASAVGGLDEKGLMRAHGGSLCAATTTAAGSPCCSARCGASPEIRGEPPRWPECASESFECPWIAGRLRGNLRLGRRRE
jgi:hypothetical protein